MLHKTGSQSVKDALQTRDITDLRQSLTELTTLVKEGFAGTHTRQDVTNGKVLKAGQDIVDLKVETDKKVEALRFRFQYNRIIWYLFTVSLTAIVGLLSYILFNH